MTNAALRAPSIFIITPQRCNYNIENVANTLGIDKYDYARFALKKATLFAMKPETVLRKADIIRYGYKVENKPITDNLKCISTMADDKLFANILRTLIMKEDKTHIGANNCWNNLITYLIEEAGDRYKFEIPDDKMAKDFIEFAQNFSKNVLNKQIFQFVIKK